MKLEINRGKDFSRDSIEFNAWADPGSYVAFAGMPHDLYIRGLNDGITENNVREFLFLTGARCSSVVRAMGRRIDPSWGGPSELFLVPASAPRLV